MKLEFIALDKLSVSKANMRYGRKAPDVSDILPTVRARGILQPLIVRPNCAPDGFEIVAGARRFHAASIVAGETGQDDPLPCAILDDGDDAAAVEASLIENLARLDPDEVTQWENFVRLVKEGRKPADIAATFGLADTAVRRVLALGNLLPRIRRLYRDEAIDAATVRHLTMASKAQQKSWLALFDDPDGYVPTGYQLKSWLFGGAAISTKVALFDLDGFDGQIVGDLFGEERYFADPDQFWTAQNAAIEARRAEYLEAGWGDVAVVPPGETFHSWEYERATKRKGGRIYIDVTPRGEVAFHEGYVTRAEARRAANGGQAGSDTKPTRPEVTGPMQTYIDLHRHAAVRAALTGHPHVALRMLVAHAIVGSSLWTVRIEPQSSRNQAVAESVEVCAAEAAFDEKRRAVLGVLGFDADAPTIAGGNGDPHALARVFLRLLELPEPVVLEVVAIVMGETLVAGSAAVEALGIEIGVDMATWWQADDAFLGLIRDREILGRLVADVAGGTVAAANAGEKVKTLRAIIADHLGGANGRTKVEGWVPRWMAFPPSAYTPRGGVGTTAAHALVEAARLPEDESDPDATPGAAVIADPERLAA